MKIGIQSVCAADLELEGVIALAQAEGLAGVELATGYDGLLRDDPAGPQWHLSLDNLLANAERAALAARSAGIEIYSLATYRLAGELQNLESVFRAAQSIGCPFVRIRPGVYDPALGYWASMERSRRHLGQTIELARNYGIRPVIELHENTMADGVLACWELVREFKPRDVGIIFDAGNARVYGYQPWPQSLDILYDYIAYVHAKGLAWTRDKDGRLSTAFAGPEDGLVDWAELLKLLKARGFDGYVSIEDFRGGCAKKNPAWPTQRKVREWKTFLDKILATL